MTTEAQASLPATFASVEGRANRPVSTSSPGAAGGGHDRADQPWHLPAHRRGDRGPRPHRDRDQSSEFDALPNFGTSHSTI